MKFPRVLQTANSPEHNAATAIATHGGLNAIFTGGRLTQSEWLSPLAAYAFVGRIDVTSRMWTWQKKLTAQDSSTLTTVTALSVDPGGTKVACHGMDWQFTVEPANPATNVGYLFVLDASNGAVVSGLLKMTHSENQLIQSKGFSLHNSG